MIDLTKDNFIQPPECHRNSRWVGKFEGQLLHHLEDLEILSI